MAVLDTGHINIIVDMRVIGGKMTRDHFDRDFAVLRGFNFDRSAFHTIPPFSNCWNEFSSRSHPQIGVLMQKANALEILQTRIAVDLSIPYHLFVKNAI